MIRVVTEYISASCNVHPRCCDVIDSLVCFGSSNALAICDFKGMPQIRETKVGHKGQVNCVRWVRPHSGSAEHLVSCSTDKTFVVWRMEEGGLVLQDSIEAHSDSITCLDVLLTTQGNIIIITTSVDSATKVWSHDLNSVRSKTDLSDELEMSGRLVMSLSSVELNRGEVLIACGAEDNNIHLHLSSQNNKYTWMSSLKGHTDWVRDLSFDQGGEDGWTLASAGQDGYVRLWKVAPSGDAGHSRVQLSSVLEAHEGWVQSVQWVCNQDGATHLLTSSLDHNVALWRQDDESCLWLEQARFCQGEAAMRAIASSDLIISHNYTGSFQVWQDQKNGRWEMVGGCGGHMGGVADVSWNTEGDFLFSSGSDKTTRLHASIKKDDTTPSWCQISRPQVHGYKVNALAPISRFSFASGSEEKVVRVFEAPSSFLTTLTALTHTVLEHIAVTGEVMLPALALSNKAVSNKAVSQAALSHWHRGPPSEEWLRRALWLETEKLYGHNFEIFSLASCPSRCLLASASKASTSDAASILLWSCTTWSLLQRLQAHSSTVTHLSFSAHGNHLLSVSKDRTWSLYTLKDEHYEHVMTGKGHSRVIWACAWTHDQLYFATVSRDKKVMVWGLGEGGWGQASEFFSPQEAVTAVDFAPSLNGDGRYVMVVGMESGGMMVVSWSPLLKPAWNTIATLNHHTAHHKAVKRIKFRPRQNAHSDEFASCSEDGAVKIFSLQRL